jgi:two-component system, NtrC family, response regulator GlrR
MLLQEEKMGETILVVDDELDMLNAIEDALSFKSYVVHRARDGEQAWEMFSNKKPAMILSDLRMPKMDGCRLFDLIRGSERNANTPFIFMSSTPELITSVGLYTVLRKPFQFDTLIRKVESAIAFGAESK